VHNYVYRFEIRPGKWVYIQEARAAKAALSVIAKISRKYRPHRIFFNLRRRGGHVAALHLHEKNGHFSRFDITDFFGRVTRTKIVRALRQVGFDPREAMNFAFNAVVVEAGRRALPFGFRQSPLIANLVLERSLLGARLRSAHAQGFTVSVYVDDIIVSGNDPAALTALSHELIAAAAASNMPFGERKQVVAAASAEAFNCVLQAGGSSFTDERFERFVQSHGVVSPAGQEAIERYIKAVNRNELVRFAKEVGSPLGGLPSHISRP
jgi:hypothetical protein